MGVSVDEKRNSNESSEADRVVSFYEGFDEGARLASDRGHEIERRTTLEYLGRYVKPGDRVLDACAGTGGYCFDLARRGCSVVAGDLAGCNMKVLCAHPDASLLEATYTGDLRDLPGFADGSFDAVLVLGAYYHLQERAGRARMLAEAVRLCRAGGIVAVSTLMRRGCFDMNFAKRPASIDETIDQYRTGLKKVFYRATPEEAEHDCAQAGLEMLCHVATDGGVFLLVPQIEGLSAEQFERYYAWHLDTCEDRSTLGSSVHTLYVGRKR